MTRNINLLLTELMVATSMCGSSHPKIVREIDLNAIIRETEELLPSNHSVQDISFSPDEKWVAVGVGVHHKRDPARVYAVSHILIVPVKGAGTGIIQIDPGNRVAPSSLIWSPDSSFLVDSWEDTTKVYSVSSGKALRLDGSANKVGPVVGFIDNDRFLALRSATQIERVRAYIAQARQVFDTFDSRGRLLDTWSAPGPWNALFTNPDKHLVAFSDGNRRQRPKRFIFDYASKSIVGSWPVDVPPAESNFAESGKTICSVGPYGRDAHYPQCFDVGTGKVIAKFREFSGGDPASVSSHGSRVVLTHVRLHRGITEESDAHSFQNRVVWDFRTDQKIATWKPITQIDETGMKPPYDKATGWGPFVISPSGRYLADGGNGVLRIYELP